MNKHFYPLFRRNRPQRGFTLIELLITFVIIAVICTFGVSTFINTRKARELSTLADSLSFKLDQAKTNAIAGRFGTGSGVLFSSSSYTYFLGNAYDSGTTTNQTTEITSGYELGTTLPAGNNYIVFSRLSGTPQSNATVTISRQSDPSKFVQIIIGNLGNITVIK
jgi:prepilin-type N-terminal cleavage/methylation domain-containing protein